MDYTADADDADSELQCSVSVSDPRYYKSTSMPVRIYSE